MPLRRVKAFAEALEYSGLMTQEDACAYLKSLPQQQWPHQEDQFASMLVESGKLTPFQADSLLSGRLTRMVLGNYIMLDLIGSGGMGHVYKAEHRRMERIVALKVLQEKAVRSPESLERFQREIKAAARLSHPNIVTAYDAGVSEGVHYLVMEFVDGRDLASLAKKQPLPVEQALQCAVQAAQGMGYAHQAGVVHRDIKPANLLLSSEGEVKITDMGIALLAQCDDDATQLTSDGVLLGTVDYLAPEQASSLDAVDARSDIYSLGCSLYYLLAGEPPFVGRSFFDKVIAHKQEPLPLISHVRSDAPPAVDRVLQTMTAKQPDTRFQSMDEVVEALRDVAAELPLDGVGRTRWVAVDPTRAACAPAGADQETVGYPPASETKTEAIEKLRSLVETKGAEDRFLEAEREHALFREGAELSLSLAEIETAINHCCQQHGWTRQTVLADKLTAMLLEASKDDGRIDRREFMHVVRFAEIRHMPRDLAEEYCATVVLDNHWPVKQGWFYPWFSRLCSRHGLNY